MDTTKDPLHHLRSYAAQLRTKIKSCYHKDHFFDAEKYEFQLEEVENEIRAITNGKL